MGFDQDGFVAGGGARLTLGRDWASCVQAGFEAGVSDPERQRLFGRAAAWVHKADLYFGVKASGGFVEAGKPWSAELIAVRPDGSPAAQFWKVSGSPELHANVPSTSRSVSPMIAPLAGP